MCVHYSKSKIVGKAKKTKGLEKGLGVESIEFLQFLLCVHSPGCYVHKSVLIQRIHNFKKRFG